MTADIIVNLDKEQSIIKIEQVNVTDELIAFINTYPKNLGNEKPLNDFTDAVYLLINSILDDVCPITKMSDIEQENQESFVEHICYSTPFTVDLVDKLNALNLSFMGSNFLFK